MWLPDSQNGAPKMVAVSAVVNTTKGGSAILECLVEGFVGTQITWHKMGELYWPHDHKQRKNLSLSFSISQILLDALFYEKNAFLNISLKFLIH